MMKLTLLNKIIFSIAIITSISSCCGNQINGTFLLSEEEKAFFPDTTIEFFKMVDNNGISDEFRIIKTGWSAPFHLINHNSEPNRCGDGYVTESYNAQYRSSINDFIFSISLMSLFDGNELTIKWNQLFYLTYEFNNKSATLTYPYGGEIDDTTTYHPVIKLLDSLTVADTVYQEVMLIDLLDIVEDVKVPKKIYIAKQLGLVKFELKNGMIYERVD